MHEILRPLPPVLEALKRLSEADAGDRGAVFTRQEVVSFILDLVGYTSDKPLCEMRLLEPSVGHGDFLIPAIERLLDSVKSQACLVPEALSDSIRAIEIHKGSLQRTKERVITILKSRGIEDEAAHFLSEKWLVQGDFLLTELPHDFTHVVGNPPYVRQEMIPSALLSEYRTRFRTIYDRADLYVPFIEKSLDSLANAGALGFICSDRWMKNKYGAPLREFVSKRFHLSAYVDMVNTDAFHSEVVAYPAITIIEKKNGGQTNVAHRPEVSTKALTDLSLGLLGKAAHPAVSSVSGVANGSSPWMLQSLDRVAVVRRLEQGFPSMEEAGCKVGIGVATGADKVFVGDFATLPVESDRKLPLAVTKDILTGEVKWTGRGVINPFQEDGKLVNLDEYPLLRSYLEKHSEQVRARNCAKKGSGWYRTIDRITPSLTYTPKLLIPDIKGDAHVVYEEGKLYPHHNLYFITSKSWSLHALQALFLSGIAKLFVSTYSVKMAGGFLRFQAQYLRRIRMPMWEDVPKSVQEELTLAGRQQNQSLANELVFELYKISAKEKLVLNER